MSHATCKDCDGPLSLVANALNTPSEARCVTRCEHCGHQWLLFARMVRVSDAAEKERSRLAKRRQRAREAVGA